MAGQEVERIFDVVLAVDVDDTVTEAADAGTADRGRGADVLIRRADRGLETPHQGSGSCIERVDRVVRVGAPEHQ